MSREHVSRGGERKSAEVTEEKSSRGSFQMPPGVMQFYGLAKEPVGAPSAATGGSTLPEGTREGMERSFQSDFSDVRVHQGPEAAAMGATAYTQGSDIHFSPGSYDPSSLSGKELLGHELTHVVQQRAGVVSTPQGKDAEGPAINADPALEAEADRLGAQAARGGIVSVAGAATGVQRKVSGGVIQCGGKETKPVDQSGKKSRDDSDDELSEIDKLNEIKSAYDKMHSTVLENFKSQPKDSPYYSQRLWSYENIEKEYMLEALEMAFDSGKVDSYLSGLVIFGVCENVKGARAALLNECDRRAGRKRQPIEPLGRLFAGVAAPTEKDWKEHKAKFNYASGNDHQANMEGKTLTLQGVAAGALDELQKIAKASQVPAPNQMPTLDDFIAATIEYYVGPRELGHEMFVRAKAAISELCTQAQQANYPLWDNEVKKAIARAANAYADLTSNGSWIGNRDFRR